MEEERHRDNEVTQYVRMKACSTVSTAADKKKKRKKKKEKKRTHHWEGRRWLVIFKGAISVEWSQRRSREGHGQDRSFEIFWLVSKANHSKSQ